MIDLTNTFIFQGKRRADKKWVEGDFDAGECEEIVCTVSNKKPLARPPQSWCYVRAKG